MLSQLTGPLPRLAAKPLLTSTFTCTALAAMTAGAINVSTVAEMKAKNIAYDPTLSVVEGFTNFAKGDTTLLKRSLVQQVTPKDLLSGTEKAATSDQFKGLREGLSHYPMSMEIGSRNLLKAWRAGVLLVTAAVAGPLALLALGLAVAVLELDLHAGPGRLELLPVPGLADPGEDLALLLLDVARERVVDPAHGGEPARLLGVEAGGLLDEALDLLHLLLVLVRHPARQLGVVDAVLLERVPTYGARLATAPQTVSLQFDQAVDAFANSIDVRSANGKNVTAGPAQHLGGVADDLVDASPEEILRSEKISPFDVAETAVYLATLGKHAVVHQIVIDRLGADW